MLLLIALPLALAEGNDILLSSETCAPGEVVQAEVVLDPEPEGEVTYRWSCEEDMQVEPNDQREVEVTCPPCSAGLGVERIGQLYVVIDETGGDQTWVFSEVIVPCSADSGLSEDADSGLTEDSGAKGLPRPECGCATSSAPSAGLLLALLGLLLRRRRG
ncbi:MAG: hypothetical protein H6741_30965 [Alphaproteobacteria bacterium]|nr:hypothetical protein [Alphaproteobacteria bacterium]